MSHLNGGKRRYDVVQGRPSTAEDEHKDQDNK